MPLIQLNLREPGSMPCQKEEIVRKITDAVPLIEAETMHPGTWVPMEEICSPEWSIGGPARTAGTVSAFAAGEK
jgi:4-oxalocrotonate tautomerase